jgi:predicted HTH transcriptional regulator
LPLDLQNLQPGQAKKAIQKLLWKSVTKTIAAFLNAVGGTLLIGVEDSGTVLGIEPDFEYLKQGKQDADGWLLSLQDVIINALGAEVWNAVHVSLVRHGPQTVAVVHCPSRTTETWHTEDGGERFYVRATNATRELNGSSLLRYIRERWPS